MEDRTASWPDDALALTTVQHGIVRLVAHGRTNVQIAEPDVVTGSNGGVRFADLHCF